MAIIMERLDNYQEQILLEKIAKKRVKKIKDFYAHTIIFIIGIVIYVLKTYYGFSINFFPIQYINGFVMAIWASIYAIDLVFLFFTEYVMGKSWEERQIKKILDKKEEKQIWK